MIIDGKKLSEELLEGLALRVSRLNFVPKFVDVLIGENLVSEQYIRIKSRAAEKIGVAFEKLYFPENANPEEISQAIEKLSQDPVMSGIIVQLPLPKRFSTQIILDLIPEELDVDLMGSLRSQRFYSGDFALLPPTVGAILKILENLPVNLKDLNIIIVGRGELVGKPLAHYFQSHSINFSVAHSQTPNMSQLLLGADLIISAVGKSNLIGASCVKKGAIVIDAGTSEVSGSVVGDVNLEEVAPNASWVSPVPGGVGPVTVAMLYSNVIKVAEAKSLVSGKTLT